MPFYLCYIDDPQNLCTRGGRMTGYYGSFPTPESAQRKIEELGFQKLLHVVESDGKIKVNYRQAE